MSSTDTNPKTHAQKHQLLKELGFKIPLARECQDIREVERFFKHVGKVRDSLPHWIDGVWVGVNDNATFQKLGVVGKAPRGAIAWKFAAQEVTTILRDIVVQVGRTGALTPVAILDPVNVAGTTVSRATLHNAREIERKDIRLGDTVIVRKAGDIIPEVVNPLVELRPKNAQKFAMVKKCPACGSDIRRVGELDYCQNPRCFTQTKRQIIHFVSKAALDIDGLGPKIIEQLLNVGLIKDETDLFELTVGDLKPLERFAEKSAENLIASIENCKNVKLNNFIYALGIRHVGATLANDLANHFGTFEKLEHCTIDQLNAVYGMGEIIAQSIVDYFSDKNNQLKVRKLLKPARHASQGDAGGFIKLINPQRQEQKLAGRTFVITGSLESLTREEAEQKIRDLGGRASSSVSKETDFVVVGSEPGSKAERAKKLNINIINENKFKEML